MSVLCIADLNIVFDLRGGPVTAIRGISLEIAEGEILGVVGESGAGKSLTGTAISGLLEEPGRVVERGPVEAVLRAPRHPYTAGLMTAIPSMHVRPAARPHPERCRRKRLWQIDFGAHGGRLAGVDRGRSAGLRRTDQRAGWVCAGAEVDAAAAGPVGADLFVHQP